MPTYVYRCKKGHTFELFHSIADDSSKRCPRCRSTAKRVPAGGSGVLFKGSGFYITDYRSKSYQESAKRESGAGETKPEGAKAEGAKAPEGAKAAEGSKSDRGGAKKKESPSHGGKGGKSGKKDG